MPSNKYNQQLIGSKISMKIHPVKAEDGAEKKGGAGLKAELGNVEDVEGVDNFLPIHWGEKQFQKSVRRISKRTYETYTLIL